jgi:hypothetical protein
MLIASFWIRHQCQWLDYRYFAAAPTRDQAKAIFWSDLKAMVPAWMRVGRPRESDLTITLITGAEIVVVGLDRPQRIEGRVWNGGVVDEVANIRPGAWGENIRPALADRGGWCWLIGVPEGRGEYFDMYTYATSGQDPEWDGFTWVSADILPASEIESARRTLDDLVFQQEMEASFITFAGRVYYPFMASSHARPLAYDPRAPLILCFDFNSAPGVCAVVQEQRLPNGLDGTGVIAEVHIPRNSSTPAVCRRIIQDWGHHQGPVRVYGDATGGARGSARVLGSDWGLVKAELGPVFRDRLSMRVPSVNPPERTRVNAVNSRLQSASGEVRLMVDPKKAPNVVRDLEGVRLLKGGSGEIDKRADPALSHISGSLGYYISKEFPIVRPVGGMVRWTI